MCPLTCSVGNEWYRLHTGLPPALVSKGRRKRAMRALTCVFMSCVLKYYAKVYCQWRWGAEGLLSSTAKGLQQGLPSGSLVYCCAGIKKSSWVDYLGHRSLIYDSFSVQHRWEYKCLMYPTFIETGLDSVRIKFNWALHVL